MSTVSSFDWQLSVHFCHFLWTFVTYIYVHIAVNCCKRVSYRCPLLPTFSQLLPCFSTLAFLTDVWQVPLTHYQATSVNWCSILSATSQILRPAMFYELVSSTKTDVSGFRWQWTVARGWAVAWWPELAHYQEIKSKCKRCTIFLRSGGVVNRKIDGDNIADREVPNYRFLIVAWNQLRIALFGVLNLNGMV